MTGILQYFRWILEANYWTLDNLNKQCKHKTKVTDFTCVHEAAGACRYSCKQPPENWSEKESVSTKVTAKRHTSLTQLPRHLRFLTTHCLLSFDTSLSIFNANHKHCGKPEGSPQVYTFEDHITQRKQPQTQRPHMHVLYVYIWWKTCQFTNHIPFPHVYYKCGCIYDKIVKLY